MGRSRQRWGLVLTLALLALAPVVLPGEGAANIEEQRKRLPPPAEGCDDPIAGVWVCKDRPRGNWYRHALHIKRKAPGSEELTGHIESLVWSGGPDDLQPLPCDAFGGGVHYVVEQPSTGSYRANTLTFGASTYKVAREICGSISNYYPDSFKGELIPGETEFQSIHDDGFHEPRIRVFRRISCAGADDQHVPDLPELPTRRDEVPSACGGCSCF